MRLALTVPLLALALGCGSKVDRERMNDPGPPPDTGGGKGLPAMKSPGEGGPAFTAPPKVGTKPK